MTPDIPRVTKSGSLAVKTRIKNNQPQTSTFTANNEPNRVGMDKSRKASLLLSDKTARRLARWGVALESYFEEPQDIEGYVDPYDKLFLLKSRPLRTEEFQTVERLECNFDDIQNEVLLPEGETACTGIGAGKVYRINNETDLNSISIQRRRRSAKTKD